MLVTDVNGCTDTSSVLFTQPDSLDLTMDIISDYTGRDISCKGETDGNAVMTVIGGIGTIRYDWSKLHLLQK